MAASFLVTVIGFSGTPVYADDSKANAGTEFGEQVILKMTEPPADTPNSTSQSSPEAVPQTQATGTAPLSTLQKQATDAQSLFSSASIGLGNVMQTGPAGTMRLQGRIEILREHPIVFSPLRRSNENEINIGTGASSAISTDSRTVPSGNSLTDKGSVSASKTPNNVGYGASHETQPGAQYAGSGTAERAGGANVSRQTYPKSFVGTWAGDVTMDQVDSGPSFITNKPALWACLQAIAFVGRAGKLTIAFKQNGDSVIAEPEARFLQITSDKQNILPGQGAPLLLTFGEEQNAPSALFKSRSAELRLNTVQALSDHDFEQQIVTDNQVENSNGSAYEIGTVESVCQYHSLTPQQMQVTLARVNYAPNGKMIIKMLMHGTLTKQRTRLCQWQWQLSQTIEYKHLETKIGV